MPNAAENIAVTEKPAEKRRALGRGLESLLPSVVPPREPRTAWSPAASGDHAAVLPTVHAQEESPRDQVVELSLDLIDPNPYQTRTRFTEEQLAELAESIRTSGVIQPVVVRPGKDGRYVLILGERRCRASRLAGKTTVPAIVRTTSDLQAAEITVVENLQRQDLNCLEQANAFARLSRDFGLTQEQIGKHVGISRESVSNYMRLLRLPDTVLVYLDRGYLGFSEARELLTVVDPDKVTAIADEAVRKHLSVEQLGDLIERTNVPPVGDERAKTARWVDPNVRAAQTSLEQALGVRVRIKDRKGKGTIRIEYASLEDFDRVIGMLRGKD